MSGYSATAQSADSKPGPNWWPQLADKGESNLDPQLLPPILPLTGLKRKSRRDANESLELAIAKQLQKDIKIPHQPSVPPKHYPNRGTLNHYSHPSFKAPTETPKPSEPTSETSSAAIANRKRSHSSFPFLLITHITAVPSSNNPSLQRLGSSGLSVRSSSLEGRRRPPAPDHHSENIENSGDWPPPLIMDSNRMKGSVKKVEPSLRKTSGNCGGLLMGTSSTSYLPSSGHQGQKKRGEGRSFTGQGPITSSMEKRISPRTSRLPTAASSTNGANWKLNRDELAFRDNTTFLAIERLPRMLPEQERSSSKKVDWLAIGSSASSGEDIIPSKSSTVSRVSTNTVKEAEANSQVDLIHSSIIPNVMSKNHRQQEPEELLDIAEEEDLGGGLLDRPSSSTNGRLAASINMGTPISLEEATALKEIILGSATKMYPEGWLHQAFTFRFPAASTELSFGLVQKKGGPCGVLAVVQAFILKFLLFQTPNAAAGNQLSQLNLQLSQQQQEKALVSALTYILTQASSSQNCYIVALPGLKSHFSGLVGQYRADGVTEMLGLRKFDSASTLSDFIASNLHFFTGQDNSALIAFLASMVLSRGIRTIKDDMDMEDCPLMGAHGYCSQEMVHLCLIGKATSNTFDNEKILDEMTVLKGIEKRSDIGLLSLFEHYDAVVVGENLKTPKFPIWLVCAESHFTVLFGLQLGLERTSMADRKPIDLFYYDQLSKVQETKPILLTIDTRTTAAVSASKSSSSEDYLISPIEHCLRTKWRDAYIDWNGHEPIL